MWLAEVVCVGCLLVAGALPTHAKRIPRWWMKVAQRQGPNVCVVEEVPNTGLEFWTECRYWLNRKICGQRTRIRFECCEDFERNGDENGCTRVKPLMNLLETAESLGATKWAQYIRESGLAGELQGAAAYTLFAPTNEAFENLRRSLRSQMDAYRGNPNNPILLYHLLPTKLLSDHFQADMLAETRYQGHNVRINKYSNGMTTINCALLIRKDQNATNGVVHLISNVLDPSIGIGRNVADILLSDGRFSMLADVLDRSGYINVLRTMQGSVTVLAPSDEAFQKLPESRREKIINDNEARLALIQNHVIPHVICESAVTGDHRVSTVSRDKLKFSCDIDGTYVETTKMRGNFNLGQNGIIHMIDDVLLPDRAKNLLELAESRHLTTFVELVKKAELEDTLSHKGDYTFFVPDETAWYALDSQVLEKARRDKDLAGELLRFHGAYGRHLTNAITDNQAIMSLNEQDPVRLQVWRRALGVEDARITEPDLEAQNGVIHIINKVITPSNQSLDDVLRSLPGQSFETFLEAVGRVSQEGEDRALLSLGPGDEMFYTFFAPTDRAFRRVNQAMLRRLRVDEAFTRQVVRQHVAVNMFPETSFEKNLVYTVNGMAGPFDVKKTQDNILKVNGEEVVSSRLCAKGVIHVINKAFMPEYSYTTNTFGQGGEGGVGIPLPSIHTRRTYKNVTFVERYNGVTQEDLPGISQGTSDDLLSAPALGRKTAKRRRGGSSSSSSSPTSPPPAAVSLTSPLPSLTSPTTHDEVEETHLEGTRLEAQDEAPVNTLSGSPGDSRTPYDDPESYNEPGLRDGRHGSPRRHPGGSYRVREGSQSSLSYKPSYTTSSTTTTTSSTYSSTSIHGTREEEVESVNGLQQSGSPSSTSRRQYDPDLDRGSPSSSSSSSSSSTSRRRNNPDANRGSVSTTSSSSSSSRRRKPDLNSGPSTSSSSSIEHSTIRTRFEAFSGTSSPIPVPQHLPDGQGSSHRSFRTNYTRHSSQDRATIQSQGLSTDRLGATNRRSNPNLRDSSTNLRGYGGRLRGTTTDEREFSTDLRETDLRDSSTDIGGSGTVARGSNTDLSGSSTDITGSNTNVRGSSTVVRDSSTVVRGSITDERGSSTDVRGSNTDVRGSNTDVRGSDTDVRGPSADVRGSNSDVRGSSTDVRGSNTDVRDSDSYSGGSTTDIRGSNTENRGANTLIGGSSTNRRVSSPDIRGSNTDIRGSRTGIRGSSTNIRGSITGTRGSNADVRGSNTSIRGSNFGIRGSSTDTRGSGTISSGSNTVIGGSSTVSRGSTTDVRGSSTMVGGTSTGLHREVDARTRGSSAGVGGSNGFTTSSSRTYSYKYSGGAPGPDPYSSAILPSTNTPSSRPSPSTRDSTARPATPGGRRFSYVGHGYGQDVVGHSDQLTRLTRPSPLPYHLGTESRGYYGRETAGIRSLKEGTGNVRALEGVSGGTEGMGKSVYKYRKTSHVQHLQGPHTLQAASSLHGASSGRSTTIGSVRSSSSRRRYNITKTSYSYSVPVHHPHFPPPVRSADNKLGSLSPVSAYAFTGDEDMYADGTEFAELKGVGIENITRQEARELRRRFRKKRHHKRRGGGKGRRRRGRRGRRNRASKKTATPEE